MNVMRYKTVIGCLCLWAANAAGMIPLAAQTKQSDTGPLVFRKRVLSSESFESVGVFDVNGDGKQDIVSGAFWYEGPDFRVCHLIRQVKRYGDYWDDFSTIPMDVNGDGKMDYITGSWWSQNIRWYENPGNGSEWKEHLIDTTGNVECTRAWDIDGDGTPEIVPNTPWHALKFYRLEKDAGGRPTGRFQKVVVAASQGHGLGFGDVNGDGRGDLIVSDGWYEAPSNPFHDKWIFHPEFQLGMASVPVLVVDVNGDGKKDLIVGQAHGYGLYWYEQRQNTAKGRQWIKHPIDLANSQFHTMEWVDIDGDGKDELVTGKRYKAHDNDPGVNDPYGLYYYKWNGESFDKQIICYGSFGHGGKGTGIYFCVQDINGDGRKDVIVAGKDGLCIFYNLGYAK